MFKYNTKTVKKQGRELPHDSAQVAATEFFLKYNDKIPNQNSASLRSPRAPRDEFSRKSRKQMPRVKAASQSLRETSREMPGVTAAG